MTTLREQIERHSLEDLRRYYELLLIDLTDTDTEVRNLALRVLTVQEVNGDSFGVPAIADIVELLVKKIEGGG